MRVEQDDKRVVLSYSGGHEALQLLVEAEQGCCGAAGVEFSLASDEDGVRVSVVEKRPGLPAQTVLAAFADMGGE